jgi:hypothetical protein
VLEGDDDYIVSVSEMAEQKAAHLSITEKRECYHKIFTWIKGLLLNYEGRAFHYIKVRTLPSPTR